MNKRFLLLLALLSTYASATTLNPIQLLNPTGSTSGQAIVSTGASTAPAWASVTASGLVAQAANTVVANVTAASASPTAVALPSCSTTNSALKYTTSTGFSCGTTFALTSGTLAQFSATTSAQLAGIISDETGSGPAVFGTSPTIANPTISGATITSSSYAGSVSATTLSASSTVSGTGFSTYLASPPAIGGTAAAAGSFTTIAASSTITPSQTAGIVGTTTNNNANAGSVGEYVSNTASSVAITTTNVAQNITSVSLTAGDWDVSGSIQFVPSGVGTFSGIFSSISTTSGAIGGVGFTNSIIPSSLIATSNQSMSTPVARISVATTTTVYLVGVALWGTGTISANGLIRARRVR